MIPFSSTLSFGYLNLFFVINSACSPFYSLSLHDALPISLFAYFISKQDLARFKVPFEFVKLTLHLVYLCFPVIARSEEHTSELQSRGHLVCRLLLEKKKKHEIDISNNL